jgi:Fe/S biogenesis protein NfuA
LLILCQVSAWYNSVFCHKQREYMSENTKLEILDVSPSAADKIAELIAGRDRKDLAVRVAIHGALPGGGYQTEFKFIGREDAEGNDIIQGLDRFEFLFAPDVADKIRGAKVDFDEGRYAAGFNIEYPEGSNLPSHAQPGKEWDDPVAQKVQTVIDQYINPGIAGHGGWVALLEVKDEAAHVEMGGGCQGCGLAAVTLRQGVEKSILDAVPEIGAVVDTTEHETGENPYYPSESEQATSAQDASPFTP